MESTNIKELQQDVVFCDRVIRKHPRDDNAHYKKASLLYDLGRVTGDKSYYEKSLLCYDKAISINEQGIYFADRSRLYVDLEKPNEAVADIRKLNQLPVDESNKLYNIYVKNVQKEILRLDGVKETVEQLRLQGEISDELANTLVVYGDIISNNVVQIGVHGEKLEEHTIMFGDVHERIRFLEDALAKLSKGEGEKEVMLEELKAHMNELEENKANKSDIEPFAFKVDQEITDDPKLADYYHTLYDKLNSKLLEATVVCGDCLTIDTSRILVKGAASAIDLTIKYSLGIGIPVGQSISSAIGVYDKNAIKQKSAAIANLASDPSAKHNVIKLLAQEITLNSKDRITNATSEHEEIKDWSQPSVVQYLKNKFIFNLEKYAQYNTQQILACIDAVKIVWVLSKGLIKGDKGEEQVINQLLELPRNYKLSVVKTLPILGLPIYSKRKVILTNQLGKADELDDELDEQETKVQTANCNALL